MKNGQAINYLLLDFGNFQGFCLELNIVTVHARGNINSILKAKVLSKSILHLFILKHDPKWIAKEIKKNSCQMQSSTTKWVLCFHDNYHFPTALWIIVAYASGRWNEIWYCPALGSFSRL